MRCDRGGADQPHKEDCGTENRRLKAHRHADGQTKTHHGTIARPIRPPKTTEQAVAPEIFVPQQNGGHDEEHQPIDQTASQPCPDKAKRGQTKSAKDKPVIQHRIGDHAQ